jgi:hypothetical protein
MKNERSIRLLLSVIASLLAANLFVRTTSPVQPARAAGIPDSGAQMQMVVDELKEVNKKVEGLNTFLQSGSLTVKVKDPKADK